MLVLFLASVVLGLGVFFFLFMKAFKEPLVDVVAVNVEDPLKSSQDRADYQVMIGAANEKIRTMEKLLDEKNALIGQWQRSSSSGEIHHDQVESLKGILQGQIDTLKRQNRDLKQELAQALEENIALQAQVYASDSYRTADRSLNVSYVQPAVLQDVFSSEGKINS
ncbi:MAG: hypothetical protein V2A70_10195 [Candidatus Omnitrophota bacterium]